MAEENPAPSVRRLCHLLPKNCALLVCDMQEKFRPAILHFDQIVRNTSRLGETLNLYYICFNPFLLVETCKLLGVPILATEQYPKGLGPTVEEVGLKVNTK